MTTRITQVNGQTGRTTTLRVEGSLRLADAELLESTYHELCAKHEGAIAIDLAGTNFLDSDSASILCRLKGKGVELLRSTSKLSSCGPVRNASACGLFISKFK